MACGKPVICTQLHNGVNAVNPHGVTGLTVPTHDASALAHAMDALNDASLRQQLGQQAQARALCNYSLQAMGEQHIQLYQALLSTRS
jgi:glycosyltransferase involved in cell wall biosynthesis